MTGRAPTTGRATLLVTLLTWAMAGCGTSAPSSSATPVATTPAAAVTVAGTPAAPAGTVAANSAAVTTAAGTTDTAGPTVDRALITRIEATLVTVATTAPITHECPIGDLSALPAPVPGLPAFDESGVKGVGAPGFRCFSGASTGTQLTVISVELSLRGADIANYLSETGFMTPVQRRPLAGGDLVTECPREQTIGDIPEHCEAAWLAPDGTFVVKYDYSGLQTSADAVGTVLSTSLTTILNKVTVP